MKVQNLKYWESFNNFFSKLMAFFSEVDPTTLPSGYEATLVFKDKNNPSPSIEKVWDFPKIIPKRNGGIATSNHHLPPVV